MVCLKLIDTKHPLQYWLFFSMVLNTLQSTNGISPQYWSYSRVLLVSLNSAEHSSRVLNILHSTDSSIPSQNWISKALMVSLTELNIIHRTDSIPAQYWIPVHCDNDILHCTYGILNRTDVLQRVIHRENLRVHEPLLASSVLCNEVTFINLFQETNPNTDNSTIHHCARNKDTC